MLKLLINGRSFCSRSNNVITRMKYLNVAEKNDAAKNIANQLSGGTSQRSEGLSKFNKIYKFNANVQGRQADMIMTSVSGHLMGRDYPLAYNKWDAIDPLVLFTAPVIKYCPQNYLPIKKTLEREIRNCHGLIIWTDCDREGENIGYEIIDVCRAIKPNIEVHRAVFSEITSPAVKRALANLQQPDFLKSQAVDVRTELDLRIGAAFTRYQTLRYKRLFPTLLDQKLVPLNIRTVISKKFLALNGDEARIYELIVRHFLACVSRDGVGSETIVNVQIADEEFTATGLIIHERNYLEVYIYDKWTGKEIHPYQQGERFNPTELAMKEGITTAPAMLTEEELIALMDKHGIGTDATHAEHISKIKDRSYIAENEGRFLVPGILGMGLVEGYESIDIPLAKPQLRAYLEKDLQLICDGRKQADDVLREQIRIHKEVFEKILASVTLMDATLANRLQETPVNAPAPQSTTQLHEVHKCPRCSAMVALKTVNESRVMLTCLGFPACNYSMWLPQEYFKEPVVTDDICENCGPGYKKIQLKLKSMHLMSFLNDNNAEGLRYKTCPACDRSLKDLCTQGDNHQNSSTSGQANNTTVANSSRDNGGYINPNTRNYRGGATNTSRTANQNNDGASRAGNGTANTRNRGDANGSRRPPSNNNADEVKCPKCGKVLTPITSHSAANPGRQFYKCCDKFLNWTDEITVSSTRPGQGPSTGSLNANRTNTGNKTTNLPPPPPPSTGITCTKCDRPANLKKVTKESANKGKYFNNCSECPDYFKWADEVATTDSATGSVPSSSRNSGVAARPRAKRKCGNCGQEGHQRNRCPNNHS